MWSSVDEQQVYVSGSSGDVEDYESMKSAKTTTTTAGGGSIVQSLSICDESVGGGSTGGGRPVEVREVDEVIPEATNDHESQLIHREHDQHEHQKSHNEDVATSDPHTEVESLLTHKDHEENIAMVHGLDTNRPILERTSIVGQSREAYGRTSSIYTSFAMVASALCLGLAQMVCTLFVCLPARH